MNQNKKFKIAILVGNVSPNFATFFKMLAAHEKIDLMVYFCSDFGTKESFDPLFNRKILWDGPPLFEGYNYKILKNYPIQSLGKFFSYMNFAVIKEIFKNDYDAIIIHGYYGFTNWLAFFTAWIKRTPIFFRGESHLLEQRPLWRRIIKYPILKFLFKIVKVFLAIGKSNKEYFIFYGVPKEKIYLMPYFAENEYFVKHCSLFRKEKQKIKNELGIPQNFFVILYVAKLNHIKRPLDLLKAFELIRRYKENISLLLVGEGINRSDLENYVKDHGLKNVLFLGFKNRSEIPKFYAIADVFVLPSERETWGLVINEAMSCSLPVITTEIVGANFDLVRAGENGFIYPVGNIDKLAGYIKVLIENESLRDKMGKCSFEMIKDWNMSRAIEVLLTALKNLKK